MKNNKKLAVWQDSGALHDALAQVLPSESGVEIETAPAGAQIVLCENKHAAEASRHCAGAEIIVYQKPVRLGWLAERIDEAVNRKTFRPDDIHIGPCRILVSEKALDLGLGQPPLRLTDRELDILQFLHAHLGETVSRETLLDEVFEYAPDVTTHTLETHIYRLRQKIGEHGGNPSLIATTEGGYSLDTGDTP